jgi:Na+/alanine symporter
LPGHLVAIAVVPGGSDAVLWRWYDAVVLGGEAGFVRLWEPAHGEVVAQRRRPQQQYDPGTRAYLSAGLPGAEWWVAGRAVDRAEDADVELNEVGRLYTEQNMWDSVLGL